jgi:hypothetical protein
MHLRIPCAEVENRVQWPRLLAWSDEVNDLPIPAKSFTCSAVGQASMVVKGRNPQ